MRGDVRCKWKVLTSAPLSASRSALSGESSARVGYRARAHPRNGILPRHFGRGHCSIAKDARCRARGIVSNSAHCCDRYCAARPWAPAIYFSHGWDFIVGLHFLGVWKATDLVVCVWTAVGMCLVSVIALLLPAPVGKALICAGELPDSVRPRCCMRPAYLASAAAQMQPGVHIATPRRRVSLLARLPWNPVNFAPGFQNQGANPLATRSRRFSTLTFFEATAAFVAAALLALLSCSRPNYVPVCSEHGGIREMHVTDQTDQWATRDATCKDGTQQRPVQFDDGNGKWHLAVPSDR